MCKVVEEYGDERAAVAFQQGTQQKAVEDAIILIKDFNAEPELAATKMNAPLEKVLEALKTSSSQN